MNLILSFIFLLSATIGYTNNELSVYDKNTVKYFPPKEIQDRFRVLFRSQCITKDDVDDACLLNIIKGKPDINIFSNDRINASFGEAKWTPLHSAVLSGDLNLVKKFIKHGANINSVNKYNVTPLYIAAFADYPEIAKFLMQNGANPNIMPKEYICAFYSYRFAIDKVAVHIKGEMPIALASPPAFAFVFYNRLDLLKELAKHQKLTDVKNYTGDSLLSVGVWVSTDNDIALLKYLLSESVPFKYIPNVCGAFDQACITGQVNIIKLLLQNGAKINENDPSRVTSLQYTVMYNNKAATKLLLENGAHYDIFSASGLGDLKQVSKILAEFPDKINMQDSEGRTPLHWAIRQDQVPMMTYLLEHGANPEIESFQQVNSFDYAKVFGNEEICKLLEGFKKTTNVK